MLTDKDLRDLLRQQCAGRRQGHWAREHGMSPQFITDVLKGRREISERLAEALGFEVAERTWVSIGKGGNQ